MPLKFIFIIAFDIRPRLKNYVIGSLGNYATAVGLSFKRKNKDILTLAKVIHEKKKSIVNNNSTLMTVLACYLKMEPGLLDMAAISGLGGFESTAGLFVGCRMSFG